MSKLRVEFTDDNGVVSVFQIQGKDFLVGRSDINQGGLRNIQDIPDDDGGWEIGKEEQMIMSSLMHLGHYSGIWDTSDTLNQK